MTAKLVVVRPGTPSEGMAAMLRNCKVSAFPVADENGKEVHMYPYLASVSPYPNSAVTAWQLALIAVVPALAMAAWLILVFAADRKPRHRGAAAMTSAPQQPRVQEHEHEEPERKAA